MAGFDVIGEDGAPRILTLGGYTTPEQARSGRTWANLLYDLFKKDGKEVQILNGDTDGFTSAQELLMLIRDGILLKPELVICLSGFYNFAYKLGFLKKDQRGYTEILRDHPFTNPGQLDFLKEITSRFGLGQDKMYYGEINNAPAWEYWLQHVDIMHCLCEEFQIRQITFLQSCAFTSGNAISQGFFPADVYGFSQDDMERYCREFQSMYRGAAEGIKNRDYIVDISALYGAEWMYLDACHVKEEYISILTDIVYGVVSPLIN
jgi:hypothetical protein